jgi:hypothetical protein
MLLSMLTIPLEFWINRTDFTVTVKLNHAIVFQRDLKDYPRSEIRLYSLRIRVQDEDILEIIPPIVGIQ